jgi:NAD-dependent DNA ligase
MLYATLRYHKYLYYQLSDNEIADGEYDDLERRFNYIAHQCGWPESWVGSGDKAEPLEESDGSIK